MEPVSLYITAANREEAISLAHELLNERLIACANVTEHVTSLYWWQHSIEQKSEAVLVAKTVDVLVDRVTERVKKISSYNTPCVVAHPIIAGNPDFIDWIRTEVKV